MDVYYENDIWFFSEKRKIKNKLIIVMRISECKILSDRLF